MFFIKRKDYTGRWIVRIIQAALIFGIIILSVLPGVIGFARQKLKKQVRA